MNKTLSITAIALVAVVMGMSVMAPAVMQQAEAHNDAGPMKHHCAGHRLSDHICPGTELCAAPVPGHGLIHAIDRNDDGIHQHDGTEPTFCMHLNSDR